MTVIRPNSISGVTSITALANEINVFKHDGVLAGLQLNGVNHHTSSGVSTFHTLNVLGNVSVGGTLTYQDVTNVDSLGIGTFRTGINVSGGQLDVGSNIKLGNAGVITATSFVGSGSGLTGLNSDLVNDTSPQLGGNLDTNSHEISLDTSHAINFGDSNELRVFYHSGNGQIDFNGNTSLQLKTPANKYFQVVNRDNGNNIIQAQAGGAVQIYHNNTLRFETRTNDVKFYDGLVAIDNAQIQLGNSGDLKVYHDGTDSYVDNLITGNLRIRGNSAGAVELHPKGGQYGLRTIPDGATELYHSGNKKFETTANGVKVNNRFEIRNGVIFDNTANGNNCGISFNGDGIRPTNGAGTETNNTYDLGHPSYRWRNIYTNDLNLSNKGSTNSVDNTWGDYTIQEGENDLFLINNRSGKKYKFNLTEVS